jgi:3-oxoacyl-[acyl-carrier protein] reductase
MTRFAGQVALITGASRGIGRAIALQLASEGANVIVNYNRSAEQAEQVVEEIRGMGQEAYAFQADVSDEMAVRRLVRFAEAKFQCVDVLIVNAGIARDQLAASMTLQQWEEVIQINLRGAFLCVREVIPGMMLQKSGSIVLISSIAADRGGRGHVNYVASKGGLNAMVPSLAVEVAPKGIRVNAVSPGIIITKISQRIRDLVEDEILAQIPLKRFGNPEEVARAACFLASPDASYITGEILHVTGGFGI